MKHLRLLLLPFSFIYAGVIWCRNRLYDQGWYAQTSFNLPVIVVGNLAVGGTGKTPFTEYLIRLLAPQYKIATLSRGYGRKTKGFKRVETISKAEEVGDEPLQFKLKFPEITVAVNENRVKGVEILKEDHDLILLDDAFQHRALKPGLSILLLEYEGFFAPQYPLPAGNFRDLFQERKRAEIIIITKCPKEIPVKNREKIERKLAIRNSNPQIFYTRINYDLPKAISKLLHTPVKSSKLIRELSWSNVDQVLLVTGIANPQPLINYIHTHTTEVEHMDFPDHHRFTLQDVKTIRLKFEELVGAKKVILTTEKDAMRLKEDELFSILADLPICYIPINISFLYNDQDRFEARIQNYCEQYLS
jgi:tetraacyldisaccharide 4'-kinase